MNTFLSGKYKFGNKHEAFVVFFHCIMIENEFYCIGSGEKDSLDNISTTTINERDLKGKELPDDWSKSKEAYSLRYKHEQSTMTFLLKFVPLMDQLIVYGVTLEDGKTFGFDFNVNAHLLKAGPFDQQKLPEHFKDLGDLQVLFSKQVIDNFIPMEKLKEEQRKHEKSSSMEYEEQNPLEISRNNYPRGTPSSSSTDILGRSDLYPDVQPTRLFGSGGIFIGGGGGSQMGPNDPMFKKQFRPGTIPNRPPNVPPTAKFDPFGPTNGFGFGEPDPNHMKKPKSRDPDDFDYFL